MATLTLRREKGSPLTHDELDDNFVSLDVAISNPQFDSGVVVNGGGILINEGDLDIVDGDLILRNGDFKYNPRLAFHDMQAGLDRVIYDSSGGVLIGTDYNGLTSHMRVSRVGNQLLEMGCKTSNSGQHVYVQLGNAGGANGRSSGIKSTQETSDFETWKLSLVAYNPTDGFVDAIDIHSNGDVSVNTPITFHDSAYFENGLTITNGDLVVEGNILDGSGNAIVDGTVSSVDVAVPTGFASAGGPITTSGTVTLSYAGTHSLGLPNNTKQGQWDQAYGWGDHGSQGYLTDAPSNGNQYARKDGGWEVVVSSGGGITYTAGTGINITGGNVIENTAPGITYTAGDGLTLTGTQFKMSGSYNGTFTATGDVVAFSDITLKENVNPITDALDKVSQLTGITFNRIGEERKSTGLSAQELRSVLPEAVHDNDGTLAVAYGNVVGLLVEAIKELKEEVAHLKGK